MVEVGIPTLGGGEEGGVELSGVLEGLHLYSTAAPETLPIIDILIWDGEKLREGSCGDRRKRMWRRLEEAGQWADFVFCFRW